MKTTTGSIYLNQGALELDLGKLHQSAMVLRAINHPLRRQIVEFIDGREESTVSTLYISLKIEQSVTSQQLAILRDAGILKTRRDGKFIYYSVDYRCLARIMTHARALKPSI